MAKVEGYISLAPKDVSSEMLDAYTYSVEDYNGNISNVEVYKRNGTSYQFPRNLQKVRQFTQTKFEYNLVEKPLDNPVVHAEWFDLYAYQKKAKDAIVTEFSKDINVLFQAETRWGKTAGALGVVKDLNQKTLVLVDKTLLADQFVNDWTSYTGGTIDIRRVQKDVDLEGADILVSTFQYLNKNKDVLEATKYNFGTLIVDELHVSAATTYRSIIQNYPVRYRLGMTATPTRSADGLTEVLTDIFGDVKVIGKAPNALTVGWYEHRLKVHYEVDQYRPARGYEKYFLNEDVQNDIISLVLQFAREGRTIMLATNSQKIQNHYTELLSTLGVTTCVFNSDRVNKKQQADNLQEVEAGNISVFAGLNVMLKGVSIPRLSVVINMFAVGSAENLQQLVGRLKTKCEGKKPPIFVTLAPKFQNYKSNKVRDLLRGMEDTEYAEPH